MRRLFLLFALLAAGLPAIVLALPGGNDDHRAGKHDHATGGLNVPAPPPLKADGGQAPADEAAVINSAGFPEMAKVAPNYDRSALLQPAWGKGKIPKDSGTDFVGAFRLICAPSHLSYDDPIVYPGQPGRSHLHLFFGNTLADGNSTYKSLRTSGDSTCGHLNRSSYWMPALLDGRGHVVLPDYATVYYKRRPASDPGCKDIAPRGCIGLPRGLRYIFGRTIEGGVYKGDKTDGVHFICTGGSKASSNEMSDILENCPAGAQVGVQINAPDCWNGKDLDTPDHRSHMARIIYNNQGKPVCPKGFPFMIPHFTFDSWYTVPPDGLADAYFSSDRMPGMPQYPAGATVHSDWLGAWDDATLAAWLDGCVNGHLNCSGGDLGNGEQMKGAQQPPYGWKNPHTLIAVPKHGTSVTVVSPE